jgi:hypothetical protein
MATLALQTVGSVVGGAVLGPIGAAIGHLAGSAGGAAIDQSLQRQGVSPRVGAGPQLKSIDGVASTEGAGVPRVYGRARVGGQMIWATRFLERANTSYAFAQQPGKHGGYYVSQANVTYSYFANFAIGLCEGPIAFVRRIWADGAELDLTKLPIRIYRGDETQAPDPLIVAKEGVDRAPAYRGLAYVVFDDLPLEPYGNRVPQFTFEVVKPVSGLGEMIRAVNIIPGATEAGYLPSLKLNFWAPGAASAENRHQLTAATDWTASIDALQALCPNLRSVAPVVAWFGDDLRAGACTVEPRIDARLKTIGPFNYFFSYFWPTDWRVADWTRASARLVTQIDGRSAHGGTPSDDSVKGAIADLRARGLSVVLYPFLMMDIPAGNARTDPHTGAESQPPFP